MTLKVTAVWLWRGPFSRIVIMRHDGMLPGLTGLNTQLIVRVRSPLSLLKCRGILLSRYKMSCQGITQASQDGGSFG